MTAAPSPGELARLSEEVARDPRSLAFYPLARGYAVGGRGEAALRLCLRGLEHHPEHVEAHVLLGGLYRAAGQPLKAFDEWDIALRLDPEHRAARRAIGLAALESRSWDAAVRHLEQALAQAPDDVELAAALGRARARDAAPAPAAPEPTAPASAAPASAAGPFGPAELAAFRERGVVGAVLLDAQGRVLGGGMPVDGVERGAELAAALRGASDEAERALRHLGLGAWRSIVLETPAAMVHLAPLDDAMLAVGARREVPAGWVVRQAARMRDAAARWLAQLAEGAA